MSVFPSVGTAGKRLLVELTVRIRDLAGLTYREISEFILFAELQYGSLQQLYLNIHRKKDGKYQLFTFSQSVPKFITILAHP